MRSSTPVMFQPSAKSYKDEYIPVLSAKEKAEVLAGENIVFRIHYIYDNARAKRHIDAQVTLQTLYNIGAELINSGKAYSADVEVPTFDGEQKATNPSDNEKAMTALLMEKYRALPEYTLRNGRHTASNPLHALFIIRIALDHMTPESIYMMYTALKIHSMQMTMYPNCISFPNGSELLGDLAALQILRGYILNHDSHYFQFLSKQELEASVKNVDIFTASYMSIANKGETEQVDNILGGSVLRPTEQMVMQLKR